MADEIRFPFAPLQKAIYDRLKACSPTTNIYAVIPLSDPSDPDKAPTLPYLVFGRFSGIPNRTSKDDRSWLVSFQINLWSESSGTAEMAQMISDTLGALSRTPLTLESNWNVYSFEVDSGDVYEVVFEEFGPVLHGVLSLKFGIEDMS